MKIILFLAVLGFASAAPQYAEETGEMVHVRGIIEDGINKTLNGILANLTDPISIDAIPLDLGSGDTISGGLNATNIVINGVKSIAASNIHLDIFKMALNMTVHVSELLVNFKYWADLVLLDLVPLYGEGRMNVVLEDINISVAGSANLTDGLSLTNITVGITLGDATFDLNGLINNPEFSALVSTALNDNFVTFVDKNADVISSIISPIIQMILDSVVGGGDDPDNQLLQLVEEYKSYI